MRKFLSLLTFALALVMLGGCADAEENPDPSPSVSSHEDVMVEKMSLEATGWTKANSNPDLFPNSEAFYTTPEGVEVAIDLWETTDSAEAIRDSYYRDVLRASPPEEFDAFPLGSQESYGLTYPIVDPDRTVEVHYVSYDGILYRIGLLSQPGEPIPDSVHNTLRDDIRFE
ncbi:hypothetical protein [Trueperella bialowiezensis]|uniref:Lipoprotein n=1 Tax=Trueperella bialowiezensis TaxID=312285 RepID=A0A448PFX5_9ACTO|nr:hypothetical protein [Trueperella bialowiezensis]VEI13832.1 Uncharacterised protein [Trueperella bialowiezensis]